MSDSCIDNYRRLKCSWVPEDAIFENEGDCLDAFPDLGAAALVYSQSAFVALKEECDRLRGLLKDRDDDWKRIQDAEREVERVRAEYEERLKCVNETNHLKINT